MPIKIFKIFREWLSELVDPIINKKNLAANNKNVKVNDDKVDQQ